MRYAIIENQVVEAVAIADSPLESNWILITGMNPMPTKGWKYVNGVFSQPDPEPAPAVPVWKLITFEAFWDRFTNAERINYDIASQHNPAATNAQQKAAAKLRLFVQDGIAKGYYKLSANKVRNFVQGLETDGILVAGRAAQILDAPITIEEAA